jgi:homogentisate 1,2-dioxygenase
MPVTQFSIPEKYTYVNGFNSEHQSEAVLGALPIGANSPQKCPYGTYAEKLSGTVFTAPRHENLHSWLYRILPTASHLDFVPYETASPAGNANAETDTAKLHNLPNQLRWDPFELDRSHDWIAGLKRIGGAGSPSSKHGVNYYIYTAGRSMDDNTAFYSSDGEFLIVPQYGALDIQTELGDLLVRPNEIVVIPRGIRYRVNLVEESARGYVLEIYHGHFQLPELGPIGSNCLANARDFQIPHARFDRDTSTSWAVINKFDNKLFVAKQKHTPFDVVAWHGRYYPYKYDLGRFSTIGSISFDHPDPSIFTVLTAPSDHPGTAVADFVIFPPRWLVQEDTFRPPWYHRNTMSEFMGLISGDYDAKASGSGGFQPAGASLHNVMSGHGPDAETFEKASKADLKPAKVGEGSMAFMFESSLMIGVTEWGLSTCQRLQDKYSEHSWVGLQAHFELPDGVEVIERKLK